MSTKFCATDLLSETLKGNKTTYTYYGYICDCDSQSVTEIDQIQSFADEINNLQTMPNVGDSCDCTLTNCVKYARPGEQREIDRATSADSPYELVFGPNCDILGQWNARSHYFPNGFLRLVLLGLNSKRGYRIAGAAYFFSNLSQMDGIIRWLDESMLTFKTTSNHQNLVTVGTLGHNHLGPFQIID